MLLTDFFELQSRAESEGALISEMVLRVKQEHQVDAVELLLLEDPQTIILKGSTQNPEDAGRVRFSPRMGLTGYVLRTGEIVVRHPETKHPDEIRYPGYNEDAFATSVFAPLRVRNQSIGVLVLRSNEIWKPRAPEKQKITRMADAMALCLAGWRNAYRSGLQVDKLGALSEVTQTIASSPYLEEILQLLVNLTAQQFNYKVCTVRLLDESSDELVLRATQADSPEYQRKRSIKMGESIAGKAVKEMRPISVVNVLDDAEYIGHDLAAQQGLMSMICVPLSVQDHAIGVLTCYTDEIHVFEDAEIKALETIAQQAAFSIERAKLQVRHTLMQEMHHRVKNNLQQVVSLLRLQLRHKHYMSVEDAINDSIGRILAISAVHDLLSRDDLDRVGLKTVAETMVGHMQHSFASPEKNFLIDVRGEDVRLTMTQATQVALVLNELIQNALEHGLGDKVSGEIHVTFERKEEEISIWVANNGNSLPAGFNITDSANLGLQIVYNLARGLAGEFRLNDVNGWAVAEVRFTRATSD
jgi:two-component sensor histidine kinase